MDKPQWIVNDLGELGVMVEGRCFFLYKGESLEYATGLHDDGTPMKYRPVGKREFGETCWPEKWRIEGRREDRYTQCLEFVPGLSFEFVPGLSFGKQEDYDWQDLPIQTGDHQ